MGAGETLAIDQEIVSLTGIARPQLLFIPTATMDSPEYVNSIRSTFGERLGCSVDVLRLVSGDTDPEVISEKIQNADVIYVGGGNTKFMLYVWQVRGVDKLLREFVAAGKPVSGLSAGALCWFRVGNSDWPQYEGIPGVLTARLDCLGLVDLVLCPHTSGEPFRLNEFRKMMLTETGVGLGLDDCCAIQIKNDDYRLISSKHNAVGHLMYHRGNEIVEEMLLPDREFRPLAELQLREQI